MTDDKKSVQSVQRDDQNHKRAQRISGSRARRRDLDGYSEKFKLSRIEDAYGVGHRPGKEVTGPLRAEHLIGRRCRSEKNPLS